MELLNEFLDRRAKEHGYSDFDSLLSADGTLRAGYDKREVIEMIFKEWYAKHPA